MQRCGSAARLRGHLTHGDGHRGGGRVVHGDGEAIDPGVREGHVEDQNGGRLDVRHPGGRLGEVHVPRAPQDLRIALVQEADLHRVFPDFRPPALEPEHQVQAGMHGREMLHPDMLEDAQHRDFPGLVHQGIVGDDREVDVHWTLIELTLSFCLILFTTSIPFVTCPKTVCTPSRWLCGAWQMKNWLPPVSLPACAIDNVPATCLCVFFCVSHLIVYPGPPVPTGPLPVFEYGS